MRKKKILGGDNVGKKRKRKSKYKPLEKIVLATAILNLIYSIIELLQKLLE